MTTNAETIKTFQAALLAAQTHQDPDLRPEALRAKRDAMRKAATDAAHSALDPAVERATSAVGTAREAARQRLSGKYPDLIARESRWRRLLPLLEAGRSLASLIEQADPEQLAAIAEWGPTWHQAQTPFPTGVDAINFVEPDVTWIEDAVIARAAVVSDDPAPFADVATTQTEAAAAAAYSEILASVESGVSNIPASVLNALNVTDHEGYASLMGR